MVTLGILWSWTTEEHLLQVEYIPDICPAVVQHVTPNNWQVEVGTSSGFPHRIHHLDGPKRVTSRTLPVVQQTDHHFLSSWINWGLVTNLPNNWQNFI